MNSGQKSKHKGPTKFFDVKRKQDTGHWWIYNLNCKKSAKKKVFRRKKTTNIVSPNMFKDFEETKKGHLMFWRPKDTMKGKRHNFSCHKQKDKGYLVYLQGKLEEVGYGWGIFNLKYHKTA